MGLELFGYLFSKNFWFLAIFCWILTCEHRKYKICDFFLFLCLGFYFGWVCILPFIKLDFGVFYFILFFEFWVSILSGGNWFCWLYFSNTNWGSAPHVGNFW